jgi:hypothetical protein
VLGHQLSTYGAGHRLLKRECPTTETEHEAFNAMIADFFALIDELSHLLLWSDEAELEEVAETEFLKLPRGGCSASSPPRARGERNCSEGTIK